MNKSFLIMGMVTMIVAILSCQKEDPQIEDPPYNPTPYNLQVPGYVKAFVGDIPHPADNPLTEEGVVLGRTLFYEKMLSNDLTMSCATCHKQENAFDDPRPFSQGTNGSFGNRNAMAIVNAGWETNFFWDGRRNTLEGQAHDPVTNPIEMANNWPEVVSRLQASSNYPDLFFKAFGTKTIDSNLVVKAIAQFERTLTSFSSKFDKYYHEGDTSVFTPQEKAGLSIFTGKGFCKNCHSLNSLLTDRSLKNNGLDVNPADPGQMNFTNQSGDRGKFKVPTLRNIAVSAPYMHDSRFMTLEDVVNFYNADVKQSSPNIDLHMADFGTGLNLTAQEKADLVAFLHTLTDQAFLTNPKFSDPN